MPTDMYKTCADCKHCNSEGYCDVQDKKVNPNSSCGNFEEY